MTSYRTRVAFLVLLACGGSSPAAPAVDRAKVAAAIERHCGLKKGTLAIHGDGVWLNPAQDEAYEHINCALKRLRTAGIGNPGFVGNEADPNTVLQAPLRFIAEGSSVQIAGLIKAAQDDKWVIDKTGTASDGSAFVQFESGAAMTLGQSERLLKRVWQREFGDINFGAAPRKLSHPNTLDD